MKQGYFVKYDGINASVRHQGHNLNPYSFRPGQWVEVHETDFDKYKKRAKKNSTWEIKEDEVVEVSLKYFARFMGLEEQDSIEVNRYDEDNFGKKLEGTERNYVFPKGKWIEIKPSDAAFFLKKATNDFWEYDKKIISEGAVVSTAEAESEIESETVPEPKKKGRPKKEVSTETTIAETLTEPVDTAEPSEDDV